MTFLKRSILVLIIFSILFITISLFFPASITLKKVISFNADKETTTQQLKNFSFSGKLNSFDLQKQNHTYIIKDQKVGVLVNFEITIDFGFSPIKKFKGLFIQKKLNLIIDDELSKLKKTVEELPKIHNVTVMKTHRDVILWFLSIRDTLNQVTTSNIHGKLIDEVQQFILANNIQEKASPLVIYHYWSDSIIDIEAGIPIENPFNSTSTRIKLNKIDTGTYVSATHFGPYERLPETYFGINEWMRKNKVIVNGVPFEIYVTNPSTTNDSRKWETAIFFPIQ